jgi:hypothetical protein
MRPRLANKLFSKHKSQYHPDVQYDINHSRKCTDPLLVPGLGYFEINMVKGVFKLAWHVLLYDMANMMGFRTDRALAYYQKASSHHKAWQMICLRFATVDELLVPYVRARIQVGEQPSSSWYFERLANVTDPNYVFTSELIITCQCTVPLRCPEKQSCILSGRVKFSPIYYGLTMTMYQYTNRYSIETYPCGHSVPQWNSSCNMPKLYLYPDTPAAAKDPISFWRRKTDVPKCGSLKASP